MLPGAINISLLRSEEHYVECRPAINISLLTERRQSLPALGRQSCKPNTHQSSQDSLRFETPRLYDHPTPRKVCALQERGSSEARATYYPYAWGDDVAGIGYVRVYFTFSCETCGEALLYHAGIPSWHRPEQFDVEEYFMNELEEYDEGHQLGFFYLVWPARSKADLPSCVSEAVRVMYDEALSVNSNSPNSFAVLIGRALERIRRDLGIPGKELERLRSDSVGLGQIAMKITEWRNVAAHADPRNITTDQVQDIDAFFRLIIHYVYVLPHKLERAQSKIEITVDTTSEDEAVH